MNCGNGVEGVAVLSAFAIAKYPVTVCAIFAKRLGGIAKIVQFRDVVKSGNTLLNPH